MRCTAATTPGGLASRMREQEVRRELRGGEAHVRAAARTATGIAASDAGPAGPAGAHAQKDDVGPSPAVGVALAVDDRVEGVLLWVAPAAVHLGPLSHRVGGRG